MTNYGAEFSQQGIDIGRASDDQKVLDTRWPTLDIAFEPTYNATVTMPITSFESHFIVTVFEHNLGFIPAFDYQVDIFNVSPVNGGDLIFTNQNMWADKNNIYFNPLIETSDSSKSVTMSIRLRIYHVDITTFYQAPVVNPSPTDTNFDSTYGARFIGPNFAGQDMGTAPPEEFSFSSTLRPLTILQNGIQSTSSGILIIPYSYSNPPLYEVAVYRPNGLSKVTFDTVTQAGPLVGALTFSGGKSTATVNTLNIRGAQSSLAGQFAYILFKDPLNIKT